MKRLSLFLAFAFVMASCDVLDTEPKTSLDAATVLTDGTAANAILLGAYSNLQNDNYYGVEFVLNNDLIADNAIMQGFYDSQLEIDDRNVPYTNLWVSSFWPAAYRVVNTANLLITEVPGIQDDAFDTRDRVLGEAFALRALVYFDLLRVYGYHFDKSSPYGLPLLTEPIPDNDYNQIPDLARSSVSEVYDQILSDLNAAIDRLDGFTVKGRMNYWAAHALRARVNLYAGNYAAAALDATLVIEGGAASLVANLDDLYNTTGTSAETLFDVEFNDQDQSAFNTFTVRRDEYNADPDLIASFEAGDARADYLGVIRNRDRTLKYLDGTNANNAKVLRLGEVYLIRSEALAMNANDPAAGLADLNVIRERAGLAPLAGFASMDAYVDALLQERRAELNFEGHRFFDLVRMDRIDSVLGMDDFRKVFPIPRDELLISTNLQQNPNYDTP